MSVMDKGHPEGPKLSGEGAKLLADVLEDHGTDRHDSLAARRNARRYESDVLRSEATGDEKHSMLPVRRSDSVEFVFDSGAQARANKVLIATVLLTVVVFTWLIIAVWPDSGGEVASEQIPGSADIDAPPEESPSEAIVDSVTEERPDPPDVSETAFSDATTDDVIGDEVEEIEPRAAAEDLEVMIYDTAPSDGSVYSFALRIKSVSTTEEIPTEDFEIIVEHADGVSATTFSRFVHESLPLESSALATVRAEDAAPGDQFLVVWLDGVQLSRIPIERIES